MKTNHEVVVRILELGSSERWRRWRRRRQQQQQQQPAAALSARHSASTGCRIFGRHAHGLLGRCPADSGGRNPEAPLSPTPQEQERAPAPTGGEQRPARLERNSHADPARLGCGGDEAAQLCAEGDHKESAARIFMRRIGEQQTSHVGGTASSEATSKPADAQCGKMRPTSEDINHISLVDRYWESGMVVQPAASEKKAETWVKKAVTIIYIGENNFE